jgi:hypothetical protein
MGSDAAMAIVDEAGHGHRGVWNTNVTYYVLARLVIARIDRWPWARA